MAKAFATPEVYESGIGPAKSPENLTLEDLLSSPALRTCLPDLDSFYLAKMFPGISPAPLVVGTQAVNCGQGVITGNNMFTGGGWDWTVLTFSPVIGSTRNNDGYFLTQYSQAQFSANSPFPGSTATNWTGLYGSSPTAIFDSTTVWAAQLDVTIEAPAALVAGTCYRGWITMAQYNSGVSWPQAVASAEKIPMRHGDTYSLRPSIQNPALVYQLAGVPASVDNGNLGEQIGFLAFHNPAQSLTTGASAVIGINARVRANFSYWPDGSSNWSRAVANKETRNDDGQNPYLSGGMRRSADESITPIAPTSAWSSLLSMPSKLVDSVLLDSFSPSPRTKPSGFLGFISDIMGKRQVTPLFTSMFASTGTGSNWSGLMGKAQPQKDTFERKQDFPYKEQLECARMGLLRHYRVGKWQEAGYDFPTFVQAVVEVQEDEISFQEPTM